MTSRRCLPRLPPARRMQTHEAIRRFVSEKLWFCSTRLPEFLEKRKHRSTLSKYDGTQDFRQRKAYGSAAVRVSDP